MQGGKAHRSSRMWLIVAAVLLATALGLAMTMRGLAVVGVWLLVLGVVVHTYVFGHLHIAYGDAGYALYSAWKEIALSLVLVVSLVAVARRGATRSCYLGLVVCLLVVSAYGIQRGLASAAGALKILTCARDFALPVIVALAGLALGRRVSSRVLMSAILLSIAAAGVVAAYQVATFDGDTTKIWLHQLFGDVQEGVAFADFNYVRDGRLRATAFFSSPLEYSFTVLLGLFYLTFRLRYAKGLVLKALTFTALAGLFAAAYLSNTRSWLIAYAVGVCATVLFCRRAKAGRKGPSLVLVPALAIIATLLYLYSSFDVAKDMSALGRLAQYAGAPEFVHAHPGGVGYGMVGPKATYAPDSTFLTAVYNFGPVVGLGYLVLFLLPLGLAQRSARASIMARALNSDVTLGLVVVAMSNAVVYLCAFQYVLSSAVTTLVFFCAGVSIARNGLPTTRLPCGTTLAGATADIVIPPLGAVQ
jgi:hypothetical protein